MHGAEAPEQMELLVGDVRDKVCDRTFVPVMRTVPIQSVSISRWQFLSTI